MDIVDFVALNGRTTASEISDFLGLAKSSISDLVTTMIETGMLDRVRDHLIVGPFFTHLSNGFIGTRAPLEGLQRLWERQPVLHEHTLSVQSLIGHRSLCVDVHVGVHLLPMNPRAGSRAPIWTSAGGEPFLRSLPAADVLHALEVFASFGTLPVDTGDKVRTWVKTSSQSRQNELLPAATGNIELNVGITQSGGLPSALTLHLPPGLLVNVPVLQQSLAELAADLSHAPEGA